MNICCPNCLHRHSVVIAQAPQPQPTELDAATVRAIRHEAIKRYHELVMRNAKLPQRIANRLKILGFILDRETSFPRMLSLKEELGVSLACVSRSVRTYQAALDAIRNGQFPAKSAKTYDTYGDEY